MKGVFLMNLKKFLKAALCGAMVVAMAVTAGCGGGDKKADSGKKVLKVGMECAYAPYNWSQPSADGGAVKIAGSNEYAYGYDVMIAKKLADSMGADLEIHKIEWDGLAPAVVSGKVDLPQPDGPTNATNSSLVMLRLISCKTGRSLPLVVVKFLQIFAISNFIFYHPPKRLALTYQSQRFGAKASSTHFAAVTFTPVLL